MIEADAISAQVSALKAHPTVLKHHLRFRAPAQASFERVNPGILVWDWVGPCKGKLGKAPLAYYDVDGQIVTVILLTLADEVVEVELHRGDATHVLSIPDAADLWDMERGRLYSP